MATGGGGTVVGSEKKCLLDLAELVGFDTGIDHRAVQHYTVLQYVPEPETLHRGVPRLESAATPGSVRGRRRSHPLLRAAVAATPITRDTNRPATTRSPPCSRTRGQAHARRRHRRSVSVRRDRLHRHRGAGHPAQPRLITFTTGFERRDSPRSTSRWPRPRPSVPVISQGGQRGRIRRRPAEIVWYLDEPVPTPRWCRCSSSPARPASTSRWCFRGGCRRTVRRLHDLPGAAVAQALRLSTPAAAAVDGQDVPTPAGGHAGQEPAAPRITDP